MYLKVALMKNNFQLLSRLHALLSGLFGEPNMPLVGNGVGVIFEETDKKFVHLYCALTERVWASDNYAN